jgi:phage terminase small subunit
VSQPANDQAKDVGIRRDRFALEYIKDLNATEAALRCGYSPKTAYSQGHRLLQDPDIKARIQALEARRSHRVQLAADEVLTELAAIVRANVQHFTTNEQGELVLAEGAPADAFKAIASVKRKIRIVKLNEVTTTEIDIEFRLVDKVRGIDMAMKHLGIAGAERHELTGKDGSPLIPEVISIRLVRP